MKLEDALAFPPAPENPTRPSQKLGEPGTFEWDGTVGTVNTGIVDSRPTTWDQHIRDAGLDPAVVEVVEPVSVRGRVLNGDSVHYYSLRVRTRDTANSVDVDALIKLVGKAKATKAAPTGDNTYLVAFADLQLGKVDGDGVAGTWQRALDGVDRAVANLKAQRKVGNSVGPVLLSWLGDGCEGFVSQGGSSAWRTTLPLTKQILLEQRLMYHAIEQLAFLTDSLLVAGVSGNHDEAVRINGKGITNYTDSFDLLALTSVADQIRMNEAAFGHVKVYTPQDDELTLTLETSGTIVGMAHGHMWSTPARTLDWWGKQAFGQQPIGLADVLLTGHFHHYRVEQQGKRTWVQAPSLESESTYYRHHQGVTGQPGVLTALLSDARINNYVIC